MASARTIPAPTAGPSRVAGKAVRLLEVGVSIQDTGAVRSLPR